MKKLFKITSKGCIQEWEIFVKGNVIHKVYGLQKGKKQHITEEITEGKNIGRSNETSPEEQAELEAFAIWTRKKEKDYRESIDELSSKEKISGFGGYLPMLAHSYKKHGHKIKWSCYCQAKFDGIRCISRKDDNKVTLCFRSGKRIQSMQHIEKDLNAIMKNGEIFDGELYIHDADFNKLGGSIRREKNMDKSIAEKIQYYIYDFPRIKTGENLLLENIPYKYRLDEFNSRKLTSSLVRVKTEVVEDEDEMKKLFSKYIEQGYEGIIVRNIGSPYEQKRSYNLLKYKEFDEEEFKIVGYEEGRGKLSGAVGAFVCELSNGETFKAKLKGKDVTDLLIHYFKNPKEFMGKELTVQFQGLSKDNVPRFPVGKAIRFDK